MTRIALTLSAVLIGLAPTAAWADPAIGHSPCLRAPSAPLDDAMADRLAEALIAMGVRPADMESVTYAFSLWSTAYIDRRHGLSAANETLTAQGMPALAELQGRPDQVRERAAVANMPASRRATLFAFWSANAATLQGRRALKVGRHLSRRIGAVRAPADKLLIALSTRLTRHQKAGGTLPARSPRLPETPLCMDGQPIAAPLDTIPKPWRPLGLSLPKTTRLRLAFETGTTTITVRAFADADCDGVEAIFERAVPLQRREFAPVETTMTRPLE